MDRSSNRYIHELHVRYVYLNTAGSRIVVTDKRVSLSPLPLNLSYTAGEWTSGGSSFVDKDEINDDISDAQNESITFRMLHNAEKQSAKRSPGSFLDS